MNYYAVQPHNILIIVSRDKKHTLTYLYYKETKNFAIQVSNYDKEVKLANASRELTRDEAIKDYIFDSVHQACIVLITMKWLNES